MQPKIFVTEQNITKKDSNEIRVEEKLGINSMKIQKERERETEKQVT